VVLFKLAEIFVYRGAKYLRGAAGNVLGTCGGGQRFELAEGTSPRGSTFHCLDKAGIIHSVPL
jgi:hypothetical protein